MTEGGANEAARAPAASELIGVGEIESPRPETDTIRAEDVETIRAEKEENLRGWQRTQADFANYRKRVEQERVELINIAEAGLILDLLPVLDDLERAIAGVPPEARNTSWVDGVLLIERKLLHVLDQHGVAPIAAVGGDFDPHEHDAVMREGEAGEATAVIAMLQRGYRLHDRVLRPALVKVGPQTKSDSR